MKGFNHIFRAFLAVLLINLTTAAPAQEKSEPAWIDSVEISLLTCGPGQEVWSYYGHTALRIEDRAHGNDLAVNWGMFSFRQSYFIPRFVLGLTDYQMGIFSMQQFMEEYRSEGRWVEQQRLRLSRAEKTKILQAIEENNRPENRTYRYNFFFDNCTTRARNVVTGNLESRLACKDTTQLYKEPSSYRSEIHRFNDVHRWARFGNDLLLGYGADKPLTQEEWEFLPGNLEKDFGLATRLNGKGEHLVDSTFYLIAPPHLAAETAEPVTPMMVMMALGLFIVLLSAWEWVKEKNLWWADATLMVLTGLPGLVLLAMVFSQHPTVQLNFQMLLLNPLNLVFAWPLARRMKKGKPYWYFHVWGALTFMAVIMMFWQEYAEGMPILALSLLARYIRSWQMACQSEKKQMACLSEKKL